MSQSYEKLKTLLKELFQLDQSELDFGIFRIMNQKHDDITQYLDKDLKPQAENAFKNYSSEDKTEIKKELDEAVKSAQALSIDPDTVAKVKELKEKYKTGFDTAKLETEVYSDLYTFFKRYYSDGDFLSLRRYKEGVYAIPYEGEEVKLYWANHDQYYIKTSEYFRDYTFLLKDNRKVHFKIKDAQTDKDNNKAANGNERRFKPVIDEISIENNELIIPFVYESNGDKTPQKAINEEAEKAICASKEVSSFKIALTANVSTDPKKERTLLSKHLNEYTSRNTFDYFIHKDLDKFLKRELDFFIKNEIMHLDDIQHQTVAHVEQYLSKIRVMREIAHKIIAFLAQIENFQKKMWLKKKFVVECGYCITLDRVPESLYSQIIANKEQIDEWKTLYAIEDIKKSLINPGYSKKITIEFLKANPFLMIDTKYFDEEFVTEMLSSIENIDEQTDGLIINSENFQALNLLQERYKEQVKCVYIDPPYNAQSSEILYKNTYKHSSWLSLIQDRLMSSKKLLSSPFVSITAIDEVENNKLGIMLSQIFQDCEDSCISIVHNPTGQQGNNFSFTHEFAHFVFPKNCNCIGFENRDDPSRESEPDIRPLRNVSSGKNHLRTSAANCFYPIFVKNGEIVGFGDVSAVDFHPKKMNLIRKDGIIEVYPIDPSNVESKWVFARNTVELIKNELTAEYDKKKDAWDIIRRKSSFRYKSLWDDKRYSANSWGSVILNNIGSFRNIGLYIQS